jgi:hypothetical protein
MKKHIPNIFYYLWLFPVFFLLVQPLAMGRPKLFPGFLYVDSPYVEMQDTESNQARVSFTIQNMHASDPLVLLSISGESLEASIELEQLVINPGEISPTVYALVTFTNDYIVNDGNLYLGILVRRGLEAMEYVEAIEDPRALARVPLGFKLQKSGIPNEDEYLVPFQVRD